MENNCTTCRFFVIRFMDDAGTWGQCTNDKALSMRLFSIAKLDLDVPQEIKDLIREEAAITYAGRVFGCIYHEGEE
jgi:hypothetical protein